jgi:signal transduction histidine kinase
VVNGLHPAMLSHLGLVATMAWYLDEFEKRTGLGCLRSLPAETVRFDERQTLALFRCLQESLTNVAKHAAASCLTATLTVDDNRIVLNITDDGRGIAPEALAAADAFGLRGLRARMTQLGGELVLFAAAPRGTSVTATLPRHITDEEHIHD